MKIGVLVTARMGSSRLPDKHLRDVGGSPALSHLLSRIATTFADEIAGREVVCLIATGNEQRNAQLTTLVEGTCFSMFHGDDDNVPLRHLQAAKTHGLQAIVSVDGDDLFCAPEAMRAVQRLLVQGRGLAKTTGLPLGMNAFGYSSDTLAAALQGVSLETLETGWGRIFDGVVAGQDELECPGFESVRATLDYDEDLMFFDRCVRAIPGWADLPAATLVARIVDAGIHRINASLNEEYWRNFHRHIAEEQALGGATPAATPPTHGTRMSHTDDDFDTLRERLHRAIPGGAHTYSRGDDQFPAIAPPLLERGKGAYVWDTRGKRYLDYGMALRAVTLGYADPRVNAAAAAEMDKGVNLTRATLTELQAAETLIDLVPSVEMVKFGKNGSNVTTAAVKIARAYTGRRYVCIPRQHPFFSFDDWFIGTTAIKRGTVAEHAASTLVFDYNDLASLQAHFDAHPGEIAAVMLEPATTVLPAPSTQPAADGRARHFLHEVQALCRREGALFILDEMITGFRWHIAGAQAYFGVEPDLCTFGKGMANGFSVAAVGGRRDIMEVGAINRPGMERTFLLSTTHGAEMPGLGAFIETVRIYREDDVVDHLWKYGRQLQEGFAAVVARHRLSEHVALDGPAISMNYLTRDADRRPSLPMRTLLAQELLRQGVMMPWIAVSQSHGAEELRLTLDALDKALAVYAKALDDGPQRFLEGPPIRPVFRTHN